MHTRYKHQEDAYRKALNNFANGKNIALLMDPGTGKTRTTLDIAHEMYRTGKINTLLIVCPKALYNVWKSEAEKWLSTPYTLVMYISEKFGTKRTLKEFEDARSDNGFVLYLFNTEAFQTPSSRFEKVIESIQKNRNVLVALDESSYIKTPQANRTLHLLQMAKYFKYKMILTGTEIEKTLLDLYSQFEFLHANFWGYSYFLFRKRYAVMERKAFFRNVNGIVKRVEFNDVVGYQNTEELFTKIKDYSFRAKKEDCLDLPEKVHIDIKIQITDHHRAFYNAMKKNVLDGYTVQNGASLFMKLRQVSSGWIIDAAKNPKQLIDKEHDQKLQFLKADIEGHGKQCVVWAVFVHELHYLYRELSKMFSCVLFMGETDEHEREEAVRKFQSGEAQIFIGNPTTAGFGLNLQNASIMYYFSMPIRTSVLQQSQDRIHRSGQKNVCVYKYLVVENTVDQRIREIHDYDIKLQEAFRNHDTELLEKLL